MEVTLLDGSYDNYVFILHGQDNHYAVIDPSAYDLVDTFLSERGGQLDFILNTHHHGDHIGGNKQLVEKYGCQVIGPVYEEKRIPNMDQMCRDGDVVSIFGYDARVMFLPGHTTGHIAFYFFDLGMVFCGDVLFSIGCGRMFEGTPKQFWGSLKRLRALPDKTEIYCTHEYTQANGAFAQEIDPDNQALKDYMAEVIAKRDQELRTVPTILETEKKVNPFLRADDVEFQKVLNMSGENPEDVFAFIRQAKDRF